LAGACHFAIALCRSLGRNAPKLQPLRDLRRDDGMMTLSGTRVSIRQATNDMSVCFRRVKIVVSVMAGLIAQTAHLRRR
jgi:hypothetical protein